jgi:hypothetical protein
MAHMNTCISKDKAVCTAKRETYTTSMCASMFVSMYDWVAHVKLSCRAHSRITNSKDFRAVNSGCPSRQSFLYAYMCTCVYVRYYYVVKGI